MKANLIGRLPIRDDVESVTYSRAPTASECRQGYGARHYREFTPADCCHPDTRILKRWFVADDGLRYYR